MPKARPGLRRNTRGASSAWTLLLGAASAGSRMLVFGLLVTVVIAVDPAPAIRDPQTGSPEFQHAEDLYRDGQYREAAESFLEIAAQHPERPEAAEAQRLALEAARRAPDLNRPISQSGRVELSFYFGLGGASVGLLASGLAFDNYCCNSTVPLVGGTLITLTAAGAASGFAAALTPSGFPSYRAQLAATMAVWGTFFPLMGLGLGTNGFANGTPASTPVAVILLGAPFIGFFGGLALGSAFEVDSGRLSILNSGALWGVGFTLLTVGGTAGLTSSDWPLVAIAGAAGGALLASPLAYLIHPKRSQVLIVDAGTLIGGLAALAITAAAHDQDPQNMALWVASGAVVGLSAGVAFDVLRTSPITVGDTPVAFAPWKTSRATGVAAALSF
jgi:hypothetical protein